MELADKTALITGAASGLGSETARWLQSQGVRVALLDREQSMVAALAESLGGLALGADIVDEALVAAAIQAIIKQWGALHVVVNCAGIINAGLIAGKHGPMALDDFANVIQVNLIGTFNVMRLAASQMQQQEMLNADDERGVIINVASVAAYDGQIGQAAYSASKGGIVSLTLPAARELATSGIRVMAIAPGIMDTPMIAGLTDKVQQSLQSQIPFPSRFGAPKEFARLVAHIIENNYLNASVIRLDAGVRMER